MKHKLTNAGIRAIRKPGKYSDGDGLYLLVAKSGAKRWIQRVRIPGRQHATERGLGGYPAVSLKEARAAAVPPAVSEPAPRRATAPTFAEAAKRVFDLHEANWKNDKHRAGWWSSVENYAFPTLGDMPVDEIRRQDVLGVLEPIWTAKPETARRVRQRIRAVLRWAMSYDWIEFNVAGECLDGGLVRQPRIKAHFRALPYTDVPDALRTIAGTGATAASKLCFRFLALTAARSGEARGATWDEIDFEAATWTVPASRMKAGVAHRVPLSGAALDVLEQAKALDDGSGLCFPSRWNAGSQLSDMTLTKVLRDTGLADRATVHGFRSSFRDWCAETGRPRELAEAALAHTVGGVEGAYFRSDLLERRRALMDQWAAFAVQTEAATVIQFPQSA